MTPELVYVLEGLDKYTVSSDKDKSLISHRQSGKTWRGRGSKPRHYPFVKMKCHFVATGFIERVVGSNLKQAFVLVNFPWK